MFYQFDFHKSDVSTDEDLYLVSRSKSPALAQSAFEELYLRYSKPVFRFAFRFVGTREHAEEVVQDVFLEVFQGRFSVHGPGSFKGWIFVVARNKSLTLNRRLGHRSLEEEISRLSAADSGSQTKGIEAAMLESEFAARFEKAEANLPDDLKQTWGLRKAGFDTQGIARQLSIPVGTVKSRFSRLVQLLRKELSLD